MLATRSWILLFLVCWGIPPIYKRFDWSGGRFAGTSNHLKTARHKLRERHHDDLSASLRLSPWLSIWAEPWASSSKPLGTYPVAQNRNMEGFPYSNMWLRVWGMFQWSVGIFLWHHNLVCLRHAIGTCFFEIFWLELDPDCEAFHRTKTGGHPFPVWILNAVELGGDIWNFDGQNASCKFKIT